MLNIDLTQCLILGLLFELNAKRLPPWILFNHCLLSNCRHGQKKLQSFKQPQQTPPKQQ
jgi:hypothetical protein